MNASQLSQLDGRPSFTAPQIATIVHRYWGISGAMAPLNSERDQNWRVVCDGRGRFVAKVANSADDASTVNLQLQMMSTLSAAGVPCPGPIRALSGSWTETVSGHQLWLIELLPGTVWADVHVTAELCTHLGLIVGASAVALAQFDHPAAHRQIQWDLTHAEAVLAAYVGDVTGSAHRDLVGRIRRQFTTHTLPTLTTLPKGVIHNDVNDHNVLVSGTRISGLLDFGDAVYSELVNDLAVACAYAMLNQSEPLTVRDALVSGYQRHRKLLPAELAVLPDLIRTRLAMSVCISAHQRKREPRNSYLTVSERPAWCLLTQLEDLENP